MNGQKREREDDIGEWRGSLQACVILVYTIIYVFLRQDGMRDRDDRCVDIYLLRKIADIFY